MGDKTSKKSQKKKKQKEMRWRYEYAGPDEAAVDAAFAIVFDKVVKNWNNK